MDYSSGFPKQLLPMSKKGKAWRRACVDWASDRSYFNYTAVRKSVLNMKVNYDLVNGKINMKDVAAILNPGDLSTMFLPDKIQHYPIINSKLNTLRGEEAGRIFDWHARVTNPTAISQMEEEKKQAFFGATQEIVENTQITDEQAAQQLQQMQEQFDFNYQDIREQRANEVLRHYSLQDNFKQKFNDGFMDACISGSEIYQCAIEGGEPVLHRLNPMKVRAFRMGTSNRIEDADVIIYEDYWSPGHIVDTYYDELSVEDIKKLTDDLPANTTTEPVGAAGNYDDTYGFLGSAVFKGEEGVLFEGRGLEFVSDELEVLDGGLESNLLPYDVAGNVRVLHVWWKSKRKILKVKSYDPVTGEEVFDFYPETYIVDTNAGETSETYWVNQSWEGVKIGKDIYVGIRPCIVQYNTLTSPSRCHFGIVGSIYNINEGKTFSLVDMMKPYNYMYDAVHAKLVELIATNWGKLVELDLAMRPKGWEVEKWMYFARVNKVLVKDSFNEGSKGASTGKLAGGLNNASKGYVDADWGNSIQNYMNILQWVKDSMSDLVGINRQREGQTYSRETVGGIERAVMQSSYITDWLFQKHEDTKRRVLSCFLETAKAAFLGRSVKFQYILSDGSIKLMQFEGDEFAENDYGIVVDNSNDTQKLYQQMDSLAQAALQNQLLDFATVMDLYSSASLSEKLRMVRKAQTQMQQRQQEAQQQQAQQQQQLAQMQQQTEMQKLQVQDALNQRDNETKIEVAKLNAQAEFLRLGIYADENSEELRREEMQIDRDKLKAEIENFDKELRFKETELEQKKQIELKKIEAQKQSASAKAKTETKK